MGLADELVRPPPLRRPAFPRLRARRSRCMADHPDLPGYGYVVTRSDLDQLVAQRAEKAGATVWERTEATEPIVEGGLVRGATRPPQAASRRPAHGRRSGPATLVVADGANSRFGRSLGTTRNRSYPLGMAIRGYFTSPRHDEPWIDSWLDIRDKAGNVLPGYGWIFPWATAGSTSASGCCPRSTSGRRVNTTHLFESFVEYAPTSWGMPAGDPLRSAHRRPAAHGPVGRAPTSGPPTCVVGDAGRHHQPVQRRGHRLRLRDRPHGRRRRSTWPWPAATGWPCRATRPSSRTRTGCTTRWPGPSCGSSASPS